MAKLIKMSEAASLALHAMALMAANPRSPLSTREAALRLKVSEAHLSKVLQRLARGMLVKALRGPGGGFILGRDGGRITLLDVYETVEGKCEPSECLFGLPPCGAKRCILRGVIAKLDRELRGYLAKTKLSDVAWVYKEKK
jgi:Rrf2 family protein